MSLEFFFKSHFPHWASFYHKDGEQMICSNCGDSLDVKKYGVDKYGVVVVVEPPYKCPSCKKFMYNGKTKKPIEALTKDYGMRGLV